MGAGDAVTVRGADEVARTLNDLADRLGDLGDVDAAAGAVIARSAQGYAPRRTGALRASITVQVAEAGATITAGVQLRDARALVQEYGSRRGVTGKFYMRRAADSQESAVVDQYETAVKSAADKVRGA